MKTSEKSLLAGVSTRRAGHTRRMETEGHDTLTPADSAEVERAHVVLNNRHEYSKGAIAWAEAVLDRNHGGTETAR